MDIDDHMRSSVSRAAVASEREHCMLLIIICIYKWQWQCDNCR